TKPLDVEPVMPISDRKSRSDETSGADQFSRSQSPPLSGKLIHQQHQRIKRMSQDIATRAAIYGLIIQTNHPSDGFEVWPFAAKFTQNQASAPCVVGYQSLYIQTSVFGVTIVDQFDRRANGVHGVLNLGHIKGAIAWLKMPAEPYGDLKLQTEMAKIRQVDGRSRPMDAVGQHYP